MTEKYILRSKRIYDSQGKNFFSGFVVIDKGKIHTVQKGERMPSKEEYPGYEIIDCGDDVISPGFIDIHCHEDQFDDSSRCTVAEDMVRMGVTTCVAGNCGTMFQSLENFLEHVQKYGTPANYVFFTGYNFQRKNAGMDLYRPLEHTQLSLIVERLQADLERGAVGLSFGLEYAPGIDIDEIAEVCGYLQKKNPERKLALSIHIRDDKEKSIDGVKEAVNIAKRTALPVFVSHIGSMAAYGQMEEIYRILEDAVADGQEMHVDCYPYNAFCTGIGSAVFDEASMAAGKFTYKQMLFATGPFAGQYCTEELYREARKNYPRSFVIGFGMKQEQVDYAIVHPLTMICSDGFVLGQQGHPRTAGSFPRVLGRYVREEKKLSLQDALWKMTGEPAKALGLKHKGVIAEGMDADLVVFDPETIIDKADFTHVNEPPEGIHMVMVNGALAVREKEVISRNGRFVPAWEF